jgi:hypothetical protein
MIDVLQLIGDNPSSILAVPAYRGTAFRPCPRGSAYVRNPTAYFKVVTISAKFLSIGFQTV